MKKSLFIREIVVLFILLVCLIGFGLQTLVMADEIEGIEIIDTERFPEPEVVDDSSELMSINTVKEYSKAVDGDVYLSNNFKVREFACKDGSDLILIDSELVIVLQNIREHFGKAVTITSAYRTETHNEKVGGSSTSYHLKGMAADIQVAGVTAAEVAKYAETIGVRGVGQYSNFVHVDTRATKHYWVNNGSSNVTTSTHGGSYNSQPYLESDITIPTISNAKIINVSSQSFTVNCDLSDNVGIKRVWLNIYGPNNSFKGYEVSATAGNFSHTINTSDYGGEGEYTVHIYAFDFVENSSGQTEIKDIYIMKPQEVNLTLDKYAASINENVTFYYGAKYSNQYWLQIFKDNEHVYSLDLGNSTQYTMAFGEEGVYSAYISCSNEIGYVDSSWVDLTIYKDKAPIISNYKVTNICGQSFTISCDLYDEIGIEKVWLNIYGPNDSFKGYEVEAVNGAFIHTINTTDIGGEGVYVVHLYAIDCNGNESCWIDSETLCYNYADLGNDFKAYVEHSQSGNYVTVLDGNVVSSEGIGEVSQVWHFYKQPDGSYTIANVVDYLYMEMENSSETGGLKILLNEYTGHENQHFYVYFINGSYYIKPANTRLHMDVNNSTSNVELWYGKVDWAPQQFNIRQIEEEEINDYTINSLEGVVIDGSFYAEAEITKNTERDEVDAIIIAVYKDDILIDRIYMRSKFARGQNVVFGGYLQRTEGAKLKAFVWDDMASMNTLSNVIEK